MKHSRCSSCCCCRWLTLLLVASSVIYASPESSTTATVRFERQQLQQQQLQQQQQHKQQQRGDMKITGSATRITDQQLNRITTASETATTTSIATATVKPTITRVQPTATTIATNPIPIEMMTIMMKLSEATTRTAATITTATTAAPKTTSLTTTNRFTHTNSSSEDSILSTSKRRRSNEKHHGDDEIHQHGHDDTQEQQKKQQPTKLVHDSMFFGAGHAMQHEDDVIDDDIDDDSTTPDRRQQRQQQQERRRRRRQANDDMVDKCRLFVEGEPGKNELYSPDYPNDYPKNINCTRVITAPKGQIIRLDFRNSFHIEAKEECKFDFLEIRDGQYGFSNLIGKYCGTDFPPEITSKERYLWLHFHSDESIEYSGFTAIYEFIDRNRDAPSTDLNCTIEKDGFEGFVNSSDVPKEIKDTAISNKIPLDCIWRIQVQEKWKIQVKFLDFKLSKPNDCETNFLDIFPEETVMPKRKKNFCGSAGEGITSDSNILHLRFYAEPVAINTTFAILYTAYREKTNTGCTDKEYDCEDATCISHDLKCNGRDNCKFRWDEENCAKESTGQSEHVVIIIVVFGLILGGMVVTFLVNCIRKIMRDQKIIREHIRQSKESKLNEMGRNSKARSRDNLSIAMSPRQKHSQTSLHILDDVSNRYYREVVPISVQAGGKGEMKEKEHSILRHHHDMIVQTSLTCDDSSTTTTTETAAPPTMGGNVCDMGCQTRESLFATPSLIRQKSASSSLGGGGSAGGGGGVPPPPRFSTFGYDAHQPPPPPPPAVATLMRHSVRIPAGSIELEERHGGHAPAHPHAHHAHQVPARPQEVCHHHHQHQQHLQQQQQQQQQKYIQQQYIPASSGSQTLPHSGQQRAHQQHIQQQQQQPQHIQQQQQYYQQPPQHGQHQKQHQSTATILPMTTLPTTATSATATAGSGGVAPTPGGGGKGKHQKADESKVFIDIRNSAPDVIIMTSH